MITLTVYQTDANGVFVGTTEADECPLEPGVWLIPGGCVEQAPPAPGPNQVAHWNGEQWRLTESFQGQTAYDQVTGESLLIEQPGPLPDGYTLQAPGAQQVWQNGQWTADVPAQLQTRYREQVETINAVCEREILGGFVSAALGEQHHYDSAFADQLNLTSQLQLGAAGSLACRDMAGVKAYRAHTIKQLKAAGADFNSHRLARLQKALSLKQRLADALAAEDLAALEAAVWEPSA